MSCNCPECCYTAVELTTNGTPPMFYLKPFAITSPADLSVKPGCVIVTTEFYAPNYLSIKGDRWVSSDGTILTCEQLFDVLSTFTAALLVYLSDYDFQGM